MTSPAELKGDHQKVWIIDDEIENTRIFSSHLSKQFTVKTYSSAEVAFQDYGHDPTSVDLILSNIELPGMDGISLLEKLQNYETGLPSSPPVILMTGYANRDQLLKACLLRPSGFVEKPCAPEEVEHLIKKVLSETLFRRMEHELIDTLAKKSTIASELLGLYMARYVQAENLIYQRKLLLHPDPKTIKSYLAQMSQENLLNRKLDEVNLDLAALRKKST